MQILVARQPIFDRKEGLYGYDLILRRPDGSNIGGDVPAERLIVDTFLGIGIDQVAATYIRARGEWRLCDSQFDGSPGFVPLHVGRYFR